MPDFTLDPSITDAEIQRAHDATPTDFPDAAVQDDVEAALVTLAAVVPATPAEALVNAKFLTDHNVDVGVGMCLATVRGPEFQVPALWPDAETAWENSGPQHRTSDPLAIPRGAVIYWSNGRHGHVATSLGGGLCRTTDFVRLGRVDVAMIDRLGPWCGGQLNGWGETLSGFDVWPDPKAPQPAPDPKPTRPPFGLAEKERMLRNAIRRAKANGAGKRRLDGLEAWHQHIKNRLAAK